MSVNRYCVVQDGVVVNTILWDPDAHEWDPPEGCTVIPEADATNLPRPTVESDPADPVE